MDVKKKDFQEFGLDRSWPRPGPCRTLQILLAIGFLLLAKPGIAELLAPSSPDKPKPAPSLKPYPISAAFQPLVSLNGEIETGTRFALLQPNAPWGQVVSQELEDAGSLVGDSRISPMEWHIFARTRTRTRTDPRPLFQYRRAYAVRVHYRILSVDSDTEFYLLMRAGGDPKTDIVEQQWRGEAGDEGIFQTDFRILEDRSDYRLQLGIRNQGSILIRRVDILEGEHRPDQPLRQRPRFDKRQATLVWSDEFKGDTIDHHKWRILGPHKRRDGYWHPQQARIVNREHLCLRVAQVASQFHSGAIRSREKFLYGYFETRVKLPRSTGHWPAFWLFDQRVNRVGNQGRDGTEIDIFEAPWVDQRKINHALHWDGYGPHHKGSGHQHQLETTADGWHVFALDWSQAGYVFYVDGKESWRSDAGDVSESPMHLMLTDEVGGWAGPLQTDELPDQTMFDYVRIWQKK